MKKEIAKTIYNDEKYKIIKINEDHNKTTKTLYTLFWNDKVIVQFNDRRIITKSKTITYKELGNLLINSGIASKIPILIGRIATINLKLKTRWSEAEPTIMKDIRYAYRYARYVIRGRWPEIESHISKDSHYSYMYASMIIRDRWPEAEPTIMKNPFYAYLYAREIINGRWPKAERHIKKDLHCVYGYSMFVIKGRWPEAEPLIMKYPYHAYIYAKDVIKGRWPEAEKYIKRDRSYWLQYQHDYL